MYALKSNFYPAQEPKGGYIGKASITIANGARLNNISVFENAEDGTRSIAFAKFGKDNEHSYIVPLSKDAYAAMLDVVSKAVDSETHFASGKGEYGLKLEVNGTKVDEPYADGRYSITLGDFCALNGIVTREASYKKDDKTETFVAVDLPAVRDADGHVKQYTDEKGEQHIDLQYEFLKNKYKNKDGKDASMDYRVLANNIVRKYRKDLNTSLDAVIQDADAKKTAPVKEQETPTHEQNR